MGALLCPKHWEILPDWMAVHIRIRQTSSYRKIILSRLSTSVYAKHCKLTWFLWSTCSPSSVFSLLKGPAAMGFAYPECRSLICKDLGQCCVRWRLSSTLNIYVRICMYTRWSLRKTSLQCVSFEFLLYSALKRTVQMLWYFNLAAFPHSHRYSCTGHFVRRPFLYPLDVSPDLCYQPSRDHL